MTRAQTQAGTEEHDENTERGIQTDHVLKVNHDHVDCNPGVPCVYPKEVDFRIIVITFNRPKSLLLLFNSLEELHLDGATASLEIWIDRSVNGTVHNETLEMATSLRWSRGQTRVHVQKRHVGVYGQWIDTWRPKPGGKELAVFLEDDLSVSPYIYRWIRAAHQQYGSRPNVAGYTLQSEGVNNFVNLEIIRGPKKDTAYLYRMMGTWGWSPHPDVWNRFLDWYYSVSSDPNYHPYIPKAPILTKWRKWYEDKHQPELFWEIWFGHYSDIKDLFTVYNNLRVCSGKYNVFLSANRKEKGLHFDGKRPDNADKILTPASWSDDYVRFPEEPALYDWDGSKL